MTPLAVLASGLVTALGFNAPASCAAIHAGIAAIADTYLMDSTSGKSLRGAKASLPQWSPNLEKLADLVAPAVSECLAHTSDESARNVPILLGVGLPDGAFRYAGGEEALMQKIERRLGLPHNPASAIFARGQTAGVHALFRAHALLERRHAEACIVAGVDSYLRQDIVDAYERQQRIHNQNNSNGFFPGEAGAAVLVGRQTDAPASHVEIMSVGTGREPAGIQTDEPFRGEGMTRAVRAALNDANVKLEHVSWRLTDINGEHYKFKEAQFIVGRMGGVGRGSKLEMWHPIEYVGEIGAAILPCLLTLAMHVFNTGHAPGPLALVHLGNDHDERAALIVRFRERSTPT